MLLFCALFFILLIDECCVVVTHLGHHAITGKLPQPGRRGYLTLCLLQLIHEKRIKYECGFLFCFPEYFSTEKVYLYVVNISSKWRQKQIAGIIWRKYSWMNDILSVWLFSTKIWIKPVILEHSLEDHQMIKIDEQFLFMWESGKRGRIFLDQDMCTRIHLTTW